MFPLLFLAFVVVPVAELYLIIQVASGLGWLNTIAAVILISLVGAWLVKFQGLLVLARVQQRLRSGELPSRELVDGVLILGGGALLLTPGFLTDGIGLALLFPPTRIALRTWLMRRYRTGLRSGRYEQGSGGFGTRFYGSWSVIDTDATESSPGRDEPTDPRRRRPDGYGPGDELPPRGT